jgi:predicted TIM-barrel fold metal-dependent hydrolase
VGKDRLSRRLFLAKLSALAAARASVNGDAKANGQAVPWSAGTEAPHTKAPLNTTDCHHHIYDSRFPMKAQTAAPPGEATASDYRLLQKRIGITRHVAVQPSPYGFDNRCLLDALKQFGPAAKGIAVIHPDVADAELAQLDAAGVRGIRLTLANSSATNIEMAEPLAKRIAAMGWHVQINGTSERITSAMPVFKGLAVPVVFDHLAHVPNANGPMFESVVGLLQSGKAWLKLSGAYLDTKTGPPSYADTSEIAKAFLREAPRQLVWGSDWPHPSVREKPDDALLFDLLAHWTSDEVLRKQILVDNPARLYGFA